MLSANHVAARILMEQPLGLREMGEEPLLSIDARDDSENVTEMDAASVEADEDLVSIDSHPSRPQMLAVLERWLQNIEGSSARSAR